MAGSWSNSYQGSLTLPTGATTGERIVLDGVNGTISVYNAQDQLAAQILPDGSITSYGTDDQSGLPALAIMENGSFDRTMTGVPFTLTPAFMAIGYNGFGTSVITWYHAAAPQGVDAPSIDMTSESAVGAGDSDMEIAGQRIRILCTSWSMNNGPLLGMGIYGKASRTTNATFDSEAVLLTTNSMTWVAGRAYRVSIWGLLNAPAANYALLRLRKGTLATGTIWKDQMRVNSLTVSGTNVAVNLAPVLVNNTGSDITSAVSLTGTEGSTAQTWNFTASAGNVASLTVEDIGSASDWPGQPIS